MPVTQKISTVAEFQRTFGNAPVSPEGRESFKTLLMQAVTGEHPNHWSLFEKITAGCSYNDEDEYGNFKSRAYADDLGVHDYFDLLQAALMACSKENDNINAVILLGGKFSASYRDATFIKDNLPQKYMRILALYDMARDFCNHKITIEQFESFKDKITNDPEMVRRYELLSVIDDWSKTERYKLSGLISTPTTVVLNNFKKKLHDSMIAYCSDDSEESLGRLKAAEEAYRGEIVKLESERSGQAAYPYQLALRFTALNDLTAGFRVHQFMQEKEAADTARSAEEAAERERADKVRAREDDISTVKSKVDFLRNIEMPLALEELSHERDKLVLYLNGVMNKFTSVERYTRDDFIAEYQKAMNAFCNLVNEEQKKTPSYPRGATKFESAIEIEKEAGLEEMQPLYRGAAAPAGPGLFQSDVNPLHSINHLKAFAEEMRNHDFSRHAGSALLDEEGFDTLRGDDWLVTSPEAGKAKLIEAIEEKLIALPRDIKKQWTPFLPGQHEILVNFQKKVTELLKEYGADQKDADTFVQEYKKLVSSTLDPKGAWGSSLYATAGDKTHLTRPFLEGDIQAMLNSVKKPLTRHDSDDFERIEKEELRSGRGKGPAGPKR
ncbi:MAG TPA: hypothetical protein VNC84_02145 [Gammaproteobacteria bacterium]|nr:hypothetical protein [Gammaproteobacteria bacterium]